MAVRENQSLLSFIKWSDSPNYLQEFTSRFQLPQVAKVVKGQYLSIGAPTLSNPSLTPAILLTKGTSNVKVIAQCVKFKGNRRVVAFGTKIAIPESFEGYFEILSEDGKCVRCLESVSELARRFPDACLLRDSIKGYGTKVNPSGEEVWKLQMIHQGEVLLLAGEVTRPHPVDEKVTSKFLRCFDSHGSKFYLPYETKARFSPVAKEENISGVHSIRNLLNKRLPLMVRLVHGQPPVGLKTGQYVTEMRLLRQVKEETVLALPIGSKADSILPLPVSAPLKVVAITNDNFVRQNKEFIQLCSRSVELASTVNNRLHVYHSMKKEASLGGENGDNSKEEKNVNEVEYDEIDQIYDYIRGYTSLSKPVSKSETESPPSTEVSNITKGESERKVVIPVKENPKKCVHRNRNQSLPPKADNNNKSAKTSITRKQPIIHEHAPIIMNCKKYENNNKLYTKTSGDHPNRFRIFRNAKQTKPNERIPTDYIKSVVCKKKPRPIDQQLQAAPMFKLRYKSLTNLTDFDAVTSGYSEEEKIDKRSSKTQESSLIKNSPPRPKSLTNIVLELQQQQQQQVKINEKLLCKNKNNRLANNQKEFHEINSKRTTPMYL